MKFLCFGISLIATLFVASCSSGSNEAAIATAVAENIGTALAATVEAQAVQTGVAATQEALDTPTPPPDLLCAVEGEVFLDSLESIYDRWIDALQIADSTPRMTLAGPLGELQAIRRELASAEGPLCTTYAQFALDQHMTDVIDGFLMFMQDEPESQISSRFDSAGEWLDEHFEELDRIWDETLQATREAAATTSPAP